jgi:hypothetical protein
MKSLVDMENKNKLEALTIEHSDMEPIDLKQFEE